MYIFCDDTLHGLAIMVATILIQGGCDAKLIIGSDNGLSPLRRCKYFSMHIQLNAEY